MESLQAALISSDLKSDQSLSNSSNHITLFLSTQPSTDSDNKELILTVINILNKCSSNDLGYEPPLTSKFILDLFSLLSTLVSDKQSEYVSLWPLYLSDSIFNYIKTEEIIVSIRNGLDSGKSNRNLQSIVTAIPYKSSLFRCMASFGSVDLQTSTVKCFKAILSNVDLHHWLSSSAMPPSHSSTPASSDAHFTNTSADIIKEFSTSSSMSEPKFGIIGSKRPAPLLRRKSGVAVGSSSLSVKVLFYAITTNYE